MSENTNKQQEAGTPEAGGIERRHVIRLVASLVIFAALLPMLALFVPAGRWDWTTGWVYIITVAFFNFASRFLVLWKTPELAAERVQSLNAEDAPAWDKILVLFVVVVGPVTMLAVAGLDERNTWSVDVSWVVQLIAWVILVLSYLLLIWAMLANRFFSGTIRIQNERGHTAETGGPYRFMRHPGYCSAMITTLATPFMLGTLWALVPAVPVSALLVVRTALEDRILKSELDGYKDYAGQVRYRLFPGIW